MKRWITTLWQTTTLTVLVIAANQLDGQPVQAKTITINNNGFQWDASTSARDVAELLITNWGEYAGWQISPSPETRLTSGMTVTISDQQTKGLNRTVIKNLQSQQAERAAVAKPPSAPRVAAEVHSGLATWYRFGDKLTAASRSYPKGTKLRVVAVNSGKSVDVVINDYGPSVLTGIDLDLNEPAFAAIAPLGAGKVKVKYYKVS